MHGIKFNTRIPFDNFSINLANYVVGNNRAKITYEIEVLDDGMKVGDDVKINGSTLFILLKKQISSSLTVRQKYYYNLEIKATLNIIPSS
jgi:allophanate hydrolase subunit 2